MRKIQKKMILELTETFDEAHKSAENMQKNNNIETAKMLLVDCQKTAVQIIDILENSDGMDCPAIAAFREYCSAVFKSFQDLTSGNSDIDLKELNLKLNNAKKCVKDMRVKLEVVFYPYKAAMWDSMESIWKSVRLDSDCDVYVIPIPYYDRNPDLSLGKFHYEGDKYPDYVPITDYRKYDYKVRRPDIVYIHNPYDDCNYVTSVDVRYYSRCLKPYTDCLVYVPYYATSGGMSEGQYSASAYYNADYIVIQSEKYRKFFDSQIPDSKFLPYGSPKFDCAINKCKNYVVPIDWKPYIENKKAFFYNTSIGGMLNNTEIFFKKMEYVFKCFENRDDAVIIWRPHPLSESTLQSMRPQYYGVYQQIKQYYINNKIGIYDETPDIENTIALCDGYIGDQQTSVISLFGVTGKPIFILNNYIIEPPREYDRTLAFGIKTFINSEYVQYNNILFKVDMDTLECTKICRLSEYCDNSYLQGIKIGNKIYVCPKDAHDIVIIENNEIVGKVCLEQYKEEWGAFIYAYNYKNYIVLIPRNYHAIVRYNVKSGEIRYIKENINVFTGYVDGVNTTGGSCIRDNLIFISSPVNNSLLVFNAENCRMQILTNGSADNCGCRSLTDDGKDLWFVPMTGCTVTRWDPLTGELTDYRSMPKGLSVYGNENENVFSANNLFFSAADYNDMIYLPPGRANMFVAINKSTGEVSEWNPPFEIPEEFKSFYCIGNALSDIKYRCSKSSGDYYLLYSYYEGIFYRINFKTSEFTKINVDVKVQEEAEPGFDRISQWQQYGCMESAFNTLTDFLDGNITGKKFDSNKQIEAYAEITANCDGTCGKKVHEFIKKRCST